MDGMRDDAESRADRDTPTLEQRPPPRAAIGAVLGLLLLVNLAMSLYQLPLNRVIERRLCQEYYGEHDPSVLDPNGRVDEALCKIDAVQQDLGWIQGVMETIWVVGDFVMTIPLGFAAEKYGRRAVLLLNLVPRIAMLSWVVAVGTLEQWLPTRAVVVAPALSVLGGDCVLNSITYALASDLAGGDSVRRAAYFGYVSSVSYAVALLGPALASATMTVLLWLPFCAGIALLLLAVPTTSFLPRTSAPAKTSDAGSTEQTRPLLSSPRLKARDEGGSSSLFPSAARRLRTLRAVATSRPRNFSLLLASFLLTSLASSDTRLLVQYVSKRYSWPFAATGYLLSAKAVVNLVLLAVVIPTLLRARARARMRRGTSVSPDAANVRYAKTCLVVSVAGALAIGSAAEVWVLVPALLVYALGSALPVFTLSLLRSPAVSPAEPPQRVEDESDSGSSGTEAHVFSIVMLVKTVGSLLGAPLMATLWVRGIGLGGAALGTPYFVSAACYVLALAVFSGVRV